MSGPGGSLTEAQRGMLMSSMSPETCALMAGRSVAWVKRHRAALAELPQSSPVQVRAAVAAKPWSPEEDAFELPPVAVPEPAAPPLTLAPVDPAKTWREAAVEAIRAHPSTPRPARRWAEARPAVATPAPRRETTQQPDPALLGEKHYERAFVREKRAQGVSWFNISIMTRKTVPYLKTNYGGAGS